MANALVNSLLIKPHELSFSRKPTCEVAITPVPKTVLTHWLSFGVGAQVGEVGMSGFIGRGNLTFSHGAIAPVNVIFKPLFAK